MNIEIDFHLSLSLSSYLVSSIEGHGVVKNCQLALERGRKSISVKQNIFLPSIKDLVGYGPVHKLRNLKGTEGALMLCHGIMAFWRRARGYPNWCDEIYEWSLWSYHNIVGLTFWTKLCETWYSSSLTMDTLVPLNPGPSVILEATINWLCAEKNYIIIFPSFIPVTF